MSPKLREHLNAMLGKFHREVAKREPPGLCRTIAMYMCVRLALQKANNDPERKWLKGYLALLEAQADKQRTAILAQREKDGVVDTPRVRRFFSQHRKSRVAN